ncbi:ATPase, T2SS/T4P/T4SS family [Lysinibacillus capsici]|uniref:ATPase, T2SS/T4P/T4SS family n=1 Tax=Lysinibacillus TaxID=400634 RepID=UPI0023A940FD|nr:MULTISPECIES: ATPase, T2SS/T4P/T4SS family [Lysinibacillus]WEA41206.1 ATPase, T2SS/T4P/T4SS family [Lysinibacillus fusiformis]WPK07468.1 ATPase, T2SS/T4P/T4SS family [Lysinibacillus capsici]
MNVMSDQERLEKRINEILEQSFLGPYLKQLTITDIRYNGTQLRIQDNEKGRYLAPDQPSKEDVQKLVKQISDIQKRNFSHSEPQLDTEIGILRISATHQRISPDGINLAIRISRPHLAISSIADLVTGDHEPLEQLFKVLMLSENNLVICGRTGSGKTEFQKLLVGYTEEDSNIFLIEDTRDSHIKALYPEKDITSLKTIPGVFEMSDGVKTALRNNPDWTIIAETRGAVSADVLDSAKTDHAIITTLHAKGAQNIPSRFIPMIRQSPAYAIIDDQLIGNEIVEFLRWGCYLQGTRKKGGKTVRRVKELMEYTDFTSKGAVGNYVYREVKVRDQETGEYRIEQRYQPLSEKTLAELEDKELIHLVPDEFLPKGGSKQS